MVSFAPDLDMNVELFRAQDHLPGRARCSSRTGESRLAEAVEHDSGQQVPQRRLHSLRQPGKDANGSFQVFVWCTLPVESPSTVSKPLPAGNFLFAAFAV